jgi:hypothetical protein
MPIYMDRHHLEGATCHAVAADHQKDRKIEGKYGVRFITYWFDEVRFHGLLPCGSTQQGGDPKGSRRIPW